MRRAAVLAGGLCLLASAALAQQTRDLGLPPASGSQNPVLPPPSGSQYPALPPPSGQRYVPGVGGPFGEDGRRSPGRGPRGGVEGGFTSSIDASTPPASAGEVDDAAQIGAAIRACWSPPGGGEGGGSARVRFSLRRDGTLFGQPRVISGRDAVFDAAAAAAIRRCTPLRLSARLGEVIAGRPIIIHFNGHAPNSEREP